MNNHILVADDEKDIASLIKQIILLEKPGYTVDETQNIEEAENLIKNNNYSLVFIDNHFIDQSKDGIKLVESLSDEVKTNSKITMFTGVDDLMLLQQFIIAGGFQYLRKPQFVDKIIKIIDDSEFKIPAPKNPTIYVLHAPSGTGKTETEQYLKKHVPNVTQIKKYSTGNYGSERLDSIPKNWITWTTAGESMGFNPDDIYAALSFGNDCIFGTGSSEAVKKIVSNFGERTKVFGAYFSPEHDYVWSSILKSRNSNDTRKFVDLQHKRNTIMNNQTEIKYENIIKNIDFFNIPLAIKDSMIKYRLGQS